MFFLFPGQGSQAVGMGKDLYENCAESRAVLDKAAALSGTGWLDSIFEGNAEDLAQTTLAQPALLAVEIAVVECLRSRGIDASACAGHSLGEFPALVAAGVLEFDDAFALVQKRARLMSENVPEGGMAAVLGLDADAIENALPDGVQVANYNGPGQTIISGTNDGIAAAGETLKAAGAKRVMPLKVSGPFHSAFMKPASDAFREVLKDVALSAPRTIFVSSVTGAQESDPEKIRGLLADQICSPVRWTDVMLHIGPGRAVEAGPGKVLKGLAQRIEGAPEVAPAGTIEDINALEENS